ncbi:hypothetical protein [Microcoleus sp. Pol12B4]|uniref:hypothetical protein n=1 Tax=Microcoleus sp. Pol12B4 TaxID=3055395 RepID=UPI002FD18CA8
MLLLNQIILLTTTSLPFVAVVLQPTTDYLCSSKKTLTEFCELCLGQVLRLVTTIKFTRKKHWQDADAPTAEVLLPEDFPVEAKALKQLANLANVRHPQGDCVCRAATPDFHPGIRGWRSGLL